MRFVYELSSKCNISTNTNRLKTRSAKETIDRARDNEKYEPTLTLIECKSLLGRFFLHFSSVAFVIVRCERAYALVLCCVFGIFSLRSLQPTEVLGIFGLCWASGETQEERERGINRDREGKREERAKNVYEQMPYTHLIGQCHRVAYRPVNRWSCSKCSFCYWCFLLMLLLLVFLSLSMLVFFCSYFVGSMMLMMMMASCITFQFINICRVVHTRHGPNCTRLAILLNSSECWTITLQDQATTISRSHLSVFDAQTNTYTHKSPQKLAIYPFDVLQLCKLNECVSYPCSLKLTPLPDNCWSSPG